MSWVRQILGLGPKLTKRQIETDNEELEGPRTKKQKIGDNLLEDKDSPATQFIRSIGSRMASWISPTNTPKLTRREISNMDSVKRERGYDEEEVEEAFVDAEDGDVVDLTDDPKQTYSIKADSETDDDEEVVTIEPLNMDPVKYTCNSDDEEEIVTIEPKKLNSISSGNSKLNQKWLQPKLYDSDSDEEEDDEDEVVVVEVVKNNEADSILEEQIIKYDSPIKTFTGARGTYTEETSVTVNKSKKYTLVKTPSRENKDTKAKNNTYRSMHDKFFSGESSSEVKTGPNKLDLMRMRSSLRQVIKLDERDKYFNILTNYSGSNSPNVTYQSTIQQQRGRTKQSKDKITATQNSDTPIINLDPEIVTIDPPIITIDDPDIRTSSNQRMNSVTSQVKRNLTNSPDFLTELRKKYDRPRNRSILSKSLPENSNKINKNIEDNISKPIKITHQVDLESSDDEEIVDLDSDDDRQVIEVDSSDETEVVDLDESDSEDPEDLEIEEVEHLVKITPNMHESIERYCNAVPSIVLIDNYNIQVFRKDVDTLKGLNWLNDSIINFYMQMIQKRSRSPGYPKVYAANSYFYTKLMSNGYSSIKRWTKNIDIFSCDLMLIPIHLGMHWCLAVIDFRKFGIYYYDSMGGNNQNCLEALLQYIQDEFREKKRRRLDVRRFSTNIVKNIPQQFNGSDCGMFACKFAEYLSRDASISFSQKDMPHFRRRMIWEIVQDNLLHP